MSVDHHLLEKYWAGLCTPEERKAVEQWMSEGIPEESYELRFPESEQIMRDQLWQRIAQGQQKSEIQQPAKVIRMSIWFRGTAIAAVLILMIGIGIYALKKQSADETVITYQELVLPRGKKASITLSDGTKVYLNAGSRLRYPRKFSETERRVFLDGEAFFEVAKNPAKPFYVQTKQTATRVLGTRFNIQSWRGYSDRLNVEEGRVQFTAAGCKDTLILHANMQGVFDGHSLIRTTVNSANKIAWTKGIMVFNDTRLSEVIAELERWYAVQIQLNDPVLANYRLKARFDQNPSLVDVLQGISFTLNIKYKIKDKEVTLSR